MIEKTFGETTGRCKVHGTRSTEKPKKMVTVLTVHLAPCTVNLLLCTLHRVP